MPRCWRTMGNMTTPSADGSDGAVSGAPRRRFWSLGGVAAAAFFGGPLAGGLLIGVDYWRLRRPRAAWLSLLAGVCGQVATVLLPFTTRTHSSVALGALSGTLLIAGWVYRRAIAPHVPKDVAWVPLWRGALVGLGSLALTTLVVLAACHVRPFGLSAHTQGQEEDSLYYRPGVTEAEAHRVRKALEEIGFFGAHRPRAVVVGREGDLLTVGLVVRDGAWDVPETRGDCTVIEHGLLLHGVPQPLVVELLDGDYKVRYRPVVPEGTGLDP